jgi:peptide deformylase
MKCKLTDKYLTTVCDPVKPTDNVIWQIKQMRKFLGQQATGCGLAANQVGFKNQVIIVMNDYGHFDTYINPEILSHSADFSDYPEGCLSYPGVTKVINRPISIILRWDNVSRFSHTEKIEGFLARVIQHEIDHLNGQCIVGEQS